MMRSERETRRTSIPTPVTFGMYRQTEERGGTWAQAWIKGWSPPQRGTVSTASAKWLSVTTGQIAFKFLVEPPIIVVSKVPPSLGLVICFRHLEGGLDNAITIGIDKDDNRRRSGSAQF